MNRRHLAVIALVIAVPLFAAPLVSPVPDYGPHLQVATNDEPVNFPTEKVKESRLRNVTTLHYQQLSPSAQHVFNTSVNYDAAVMFAKSAPTSFPLDEAPEPWTTLASANQSGGLERSLVFVSKHGRYYAVRLIQFTPGPSFQAFMLRLGPLLAAIGLGTLAIYFVLTAED